MFSELAADQRSAARERIILRYRVRVAAFAAALLACSVPAMAAVAQLNTWTLASSSNPPGGGFSVNAGNITVTAGSQRLLVVAAVLESNNAGTVSAFNATVGGTSLTALAGTEATPARETAKVWYLLDASIPAGAAALVVSGTHTQTVDGLHIYWASFSGVDQTTPVNDSSANFNAAGSVTFGTQVDFVADGLTFFATGNGNTGATLGDNNPAGFTQRLATPNSSGHSSFTADSGVHAAAGNYPAATNIAFGGTTSARSAVVVASLRPSATDANLAIVKTGPGTVFLGDTFGYTLTVSNAGPSAATAVTVTDTLPAETIWQSATPSQGSCSGTTTVTCNLGSVANGGSATVTISVKANALGTPSNTASVAAAESDPVPGNNSSTVAVTVRQVNTADVSISKSATATVAVGSDVTYVLSIANHGPDTAEGVTVADPLPVGTTWVSTSTTLGSCSGTNLVNCVLGNMANGATATITVVATVTTAGTKSNTATLGIDTGTTYDPVPPNDSATATTAVTGGTSIRCSIPTPLGPGGTLSGVINTYYAGTASVVAGVADTCIPVGAATGALAPIAYGDLLVVVQMQDADINSTNSNNYGGNNGTGAGALGIVNAGRYEFVVALGAVGAAPCAANQVPIYGAGTNNGLLSAYNNANATVTKGQMRYQVVRVPRYTTATLNGVTAAPWVTSTAAPIGLGTGGVLAIDVQGELTLSSGVAASVDGVGFRGGAGRQLGVGRVPTPTGGP